MTADDAVDRVLAERARLLARPLAEPGTAPGDEVLVLEAGGERYAIGLGCVERVHPVASVTALPGLRRPWAGLVSLRGEILPALDLPAYLGRPSSPPGGGTGSTAMSGASTAMSCAVVASGGLRVALLSDAPVALRASAPGGLSSALAEDADPPGAVLGVTHDLVTLLDVAPILADTALVVDDEGNRT